MEYAGLSEFSKGIYSFTEGKFVKDSGDLVICVHPFYRIFERFKDDYDYFVNMNSFLSHSENPIIILEGDNNFHKIEKIFGKYEIKDNRFFVRTYDDGPGLLDLELHEFFDQINVFREEHPVGLSGGYYWGGYHGCLGSVREKFDWWGIPSKFLKGLVFS